MCCSVSLFFSHSPLYVNWPETRSTNVLAICTTHKTIGTNHNRFLTMFHIEFRSALSLIDVANLCYFVYSTRKLTSFRRFDLFLSDIFLLVATLALVQRTLLRRMRNFQDRTQSTQHKYCSLFPTFFTTSYSLSRYRTHVFTVYIILYVYLKKQKTWNWYTDITLYYTRTSWLVTFKSLSRTTKTHIFIAKIHSVLLDLLQCVIFDMEFSTHLTPSGCQITSFYNIF